MRFAPGAWRYALVSLALGLLASLLSPLLALAGVALGGGALAFYRDPDRQITPVGVAAPADGRVSVVREEGDRLRVGTFMNVTDVHVNRAPLGGVVQSVEHVSGGYRPAFSKASDHNERVRLTVDSDHGEYEVTLVAGWFARRIYPYVEVGDRIERGQRIGHISFGSRADVLLPVGVTRADLAVEEGERVVAGQTTLAYLDQLSSD